MHGSESTTVLSENDVRRVVRLLADVATVAGGHPAKKRVLMEGLRELLDADGWLWTMTRVDFARDSPMSLGIMHGGLTDEQVAGWIEMNHDVRRPPPESHALTDLVRRGHHFTRGRDQVVDNTTWYNHANVKRCRLDRGLEHSLHSIYPLDEPGVVSGVGFYRAYGRPAFTARQQHLAHLILSEVAWLHHADLPAGRGREVPQLTERQRTVLVLLLEGRPCQELARLLHISAHTVHDHTKAIYRHLEVSSHVELMGKFRGGDRRIADAC